MSFLKKIFGSSNDREIKALDIIANQIEDLESDIQKLSDTELKNKTNEFKERLSNGESLDDLLPEAYAVVREASVRVLGKRHYHVQLICGIALHQGRITEMKTGEGKTLVATLPAYLNALSGEGVHIVTVNTYLAEFHSQWMGKIYNFLGLSVGLIYPRMPKDERKNAYKADITYGTNNEFGFDYLRDNMVVYKDRMVQRGHAFAIIDEVDSILIDEARTPLIISGDAGKSTDLYKAAHQFAKRLKNDVDYEYDEKASSVHLSEEGLKRAEKYFNVSDISDIVNTELIHHINQALRANVIMKRDINYVVKNGEVLIVDEFTGRLMIGRRFSNGLHQAIEAKENVNVRKESRVLATITEQNYYRLYKKLSGMTGTAKTEEIEFQHIYGLDVVTIPTNKPLIRNDKNDLLFFSMKSKYKAVIDKCIEANKNGQPVLVGTISIEVSEMLSNMLKAKKIKHNVLNAKQHEKEAEIVSQAGQYKAITIATNMAGRGTDILLGGNPETLALSDMEKQGYSKEILGYMTSHLEVTDPDIINAKKVYEKLYEKYDKQCAIEKEKVLKAGGLLILGTERHESRRIDNQLRGRAGRQGDPGVSQFFISLEDDLLRLYGSERLQSLLPSLNDEDGLSVEFGIISKQIENAQKKIEGIHFATRKHVLQYDDVMNAQRKIIYDQRSTVLNNKELKDNILTMMKNMVKETVSSFTSGIAHPEEWNLKGLFDYLESVYLPADSVKISKDEQYNLTVESLCDKIIDKSTEIYDAKEAEITPDFMREAERVVLLRVVDRKWMEHIDNMDQLRRGISLRAIGNQDPVIAYKREGFDMFEVMVSSIQEDTVRMLYHIRKEDKNVERKAVAKPLGTNRNGAPKQKTVVKGKEPGRNDPCPCGSGLKYKKCCGKN